MSSNDRVVCTISSAKKRISTDNVWLLNLEMIEQQTGRIISRHYVEHDELLGSIVQFSADNVLYSKLRPNLNKVVLPDCDGYATSELVPLKPNSAILCREYLAAYLRSDSFVAWAVSKTTGAKMPRLGTDVLLDKINTNLPLPPLDEQRKIAAVLDKVSDLIAKRRQQLEKLDELVKARFVEMFGEYDLSHVQDDWVMISQIGSVVGGATPKTDVDEYWGGDYGWLTPADLEVDSGVVYDSQRKLTKAGIESCSLQELPIGTVMFSSRAPIGKVAITGCPFYCNQGFKNIVCGSKVVPWYLYYLLLLNTDYLNSLGRGATFKEVSKAIVEQVKIPLPAYDNQVRFGGFVEGTRNAKAIIARSLEKLETLKRALMQRYFG